MADQNNLSKPDGTSNYQTEVWQTIRGHIARLWTGDYTGMAGLVTGMRRWINLGSGNVRLVERQSDGTEDTLFDSSVYLTAAVGLGIDQTWQNKTSSRAIDTLYINNTGKPISLQISYASGVPPEMTFYSDPSDASTGVTVVMAQNGGSVTIGGFYTVVPVGHGYKASNFTIVTWAELS